MSKRDPFYRPHMSYCMFDSSGIEQPVTRRRALRAMRLARAVRLHVRGTCRVFSLPCGLRVEVRREFSLSEQPIRDQE